MDIVDLGLIGYAKALEIQNGYLEKRINGLSPDTLLILEHEPVVTLGRTDDGGGVFDRAYFAEKGIPVIKAVRGGKNTCHTPGQLVMYPIVDLSVRKRDISAYIDFLERMVANALNELGVPAQGNLARRGVWVDGKKIAFTGIAVKRWVTYHGVSVNINNDISLFSRMAPCGEGDIRVTSAKEVLGRELDMADVKRTFAGRFAEDLEKEYSGEYGNKVVRDLGLVR